MIDLLLQNNLFVLPVGEDGRWIRYHHLFRDFLQARFSAELPAEKEPLLIRLVEVYAARGEWDRAYATCLKLGQDNSLADLIERAGSALVKSGRLRTTAEWIDALPAEVLSKRPALLSMRGVAAIAQGQVEQGLSLLNTAEQAQRESGEWQGLAYSLVRRATTHRFLGDYAASLRDAQEALSLVSEADRLHPVQAEAWRASGMSLYQLGRLNEAIGHLEQSLNAYRALHDRQNVALVLMELGLASMTAGRYRLAQENYRQAFQFWQRNGNLAGQANLLNNLAVLHHLMGEYEMGIASFEEALEYAAQSGYARFEAYILSGIGDLYSDLDANEAALAAYRRSRQLAVQMDDRYLLLYIDLAEARLARKAGSLAAAELLLSTSGESLGSRGSSYELALWQLERGRLLQAQDRLPEAIDALAAAAGSFEAGGQLVEAARSALHLGVVLYLAQGLRDALPTLEQAFRLAAQLESPHVLVVAGREAEALLQAASEQGTGNTQAASLLERARTFNRQIPALRRRLRPRTVAVPFAPPKLVIHGLGRGTVELDGRPVTAPEWQNQKRVREIFFCLLAHPDGLTKEAIGLLFWPDSSPAQLKLQFKNTIYRLRCALGPEIVLFDEDRYWFNRELDYEYDVENFTSHLGRARSADSPGEKIAAYRAAVDIYRGALLPEMPGTWVWPERERLRQAYEEACLSLAEIHLAGGSPQEAIVLCQKVLAEEPCQEEAHRLAMRAYAALGNRAAVTRQFERCRRALWEEIHALPSQKTEAAYHEALG
jgi:two-component SAPR family response regulator/Flp pilus assembly protein TadD